MEDMSSLIHGHMMMPSEICGYNASRFSGAWHRLTNKKRLSAIPQRASLAIVLEGKILFS
ncbi:uncharacterized protein B0T23DRAFT_185000 [Neurospora hispaniola]|uniref:Uncharacterized protein n=1 Tax=Neurospora hispaniola TaxID=588809 RepID=A0AAJ0I307_9PEZI|nr:hypothetical protein B0T23DRAFT_185000 [Neurospora hispaniola]